eukprot:6119077-Ditylum_brightwellii.AAC.1
MIDSKEQTKEGTTNQVRNALNARQQTLKVGNTKCCATDDISAVGAAVSKKRKAEGTKKKAIQNPVFFQSCLQGRDSNESAADGILNASTKEIADSISTVIWPMPSSGEPEKKREADIQKCAADDISTSLSLDTNHSVNLVELTDKMSEALWPVRHYSDQSVGDIHSESDGTSVASSLTNNVNSYIEQQSIQNTMAKLVPLLERGLESITSVCGSNCKSVPPLPKHEKLPVSNPSTRPSCAICNVDYRAREFLAMPQHAKTKKHRNQRYMVYCKHCNLYAHDIPNHAPGQVFHKEKFRGLTCFEILHKESCTGLYEVVDTEGGGVPRIRRTHPIMKECCKSYGVNLTDAELTYGGRREFF